MWMASQPARKGQGRLMSIEHEKATDYRVVIFRKRLQFPDRALGDPQVGPARMVDIEGRCADCWGPIDGLIDGAGVWIRLECRICGRRVDGEDAQRETNRMALEAERNMPSVRVGGGAEYDEKAKFVLKILPDMDRNKAEFEQRIDAAKRRAQPKRQQQQWLTRRKFEEPGTPGYLYLQASALVSGLGALPRDMSAISLSDFDFENPGDLYGPRVGEAGGVQMSVQVPQKPSSSGRLLERMGTALTAGFAAAFACEVGMKAILMTRLDGFEKTHDLMKLYESLPKDCRERLQGDFTGIAEILGKYRHVFDKRGRYFEPGTDQDAFLALVDTDRIWGLGKAARVIVDEGVVAGLQYDIDLKYEVDIRAHPPVDEDGHFTIRPDDLTTSSKVRVEVVGHESAIPWDTILSI